MQEIAWGPHPGPQTNFCQRWEFEVLFGGAAGPGKTDCLIMEALRDVDKTNYSGIILRRTFPQLQEIIDRTREYYPLLAGEYKTGEHRWYFPSGAKINLGHMQHEGDEYNYQGKEFQYIGFDEVTQFTPKQYLYLFSRCRSTDPTIRKRIRAATNPGGIGHAFIKDRFKIGLVDTGTTIYDPKTKNSRVFIDGKLKDNPSLLENDPDYINRLMALPEIERLRLMEGLWDAFEGQALPELNRDVHGIDPFDIPLEWPRYRAMDWGYSTPFSVGWWAVDPDGIIFRYREWYGTKAGDVPNVGLRMTAGEVARGILERENVERLKGIKVRPGPADPDMWNPRWGTLGKGGSKLGVVGSSPAEDMAKEGVHFIQADNQTRIGRLAVHKRLELVAGVEPHHGDDPHDKGHPQIYIFNNCHHFWRTMPLLREREKNPEEIEGKNVENHIYDDVRYFCMFRPARPTPKVRSDTGSFQAERRKIIAAKRLAQLHGIGLIEAYGKVR